MSRILITGGAGFLGSHLCEKLLKTGNYIYCVDNFTTGRLENIQHLLDQSNFELINHDITKPINLDVDEIYNLACPASPPKYQDDPIGTIKTSILGALNLLDLADMRNAKILQASTSEVYGDPEINPQKESYWGKVNPIGLRSCYDEGKRCAETLFFDYHRQLGVKIKVARIFNTYGPKMDPLDGRVISNMVMQALSNKPITIYGDGTQTRSFCFVDDLIEGLILLMNSPNEFTHPINLGNPNEFSISQLAQVILKVCQSNSELTYTNLPSDDPKKRQPDISLAQELLGWNPSIELEEGLNKSLDYYKQFVE